MQGDQRDQVRRRLWRQLRGGGDTAAAKLVKDARFAVWNNPGNLTERQRVRLAAIAEVNKPLYRAYLLKDQLRQVFATRGEGGMLLLDGRLGRPQPAARVRRPCPRPACRRAWPFRGSAER